jgi:hypothetical protein
MTAQSIRLTENHKLWYGLRNLVIGDDEETRIWDQLTEWPEEARGEAQKFLDQEHPDFEAAYRSVLKWSIQNEAGGAHSIGSFQLRSLITLYLFNFIREELPNVPAMLKLYRELEKE